MFLQVSVTVPEAKKLIALAVRELPEFAHALKNGRVYLKGGTTVAALAEDLTGIKMHICGRVTPLGCKRERHQESESPFSILINQGEVLDASDNEEEEIMKLRRGDIFVIGANAIDKDGNGALMAGSSLGGPPGRVLGGLMGEGVRILILAGLEKLIPGTISEAVRAAGRQKPDLAYGMGVGLIPLIGELITEKDAVEMLAEVSCAVIGKGGIGGAEGATTMVIEGEQGEVEKVLACFKRIKGAETCGSPETLEECRPAKESCCTEDKACIYKAR